MGPVKDLKVKILAHPVGQRAFAAAPFVAFVGGFGFDILTLSKGASWINFAVLGTYSLFCTLLLIVQSRGWLSTWRRGLSFALQFCLGALFSALVILYFRSSGQFFSFLFVMLLFAGMVANEFLHKNERLRELIWAIYAICIAMFLNFAIPHFADSVKPIWFYASTVVGAGLIVLVWVGAGASKMTLRGPAIALSMLTLSYILGLIPPVPLVLENGLVCTDFQKSDYTCKTDPVGWKQRFGAAHVVSRDKGEAVNCLTAVSAPKGAVAQLEHRWYQEVDGKWVARDTMTFEMRGGRKAGWRFWSRKRNAAPGLWKVETALKGGSVLSVQKIRVVEPRNSAKIDAKL